MVRASSAVTASSLSSPVEQPVMRSSRALRGWYGVYMPTVLMGLATTFGAVVLFDAAWPTMMVWLACCLGLAVSCWQLVRQERMASACARRPELRDVAAEQSGVFAGVLRECIGLLAQREAEILELLDAKNHVEARAHQLKSQLARQERALANTTGALFIVDSQSRLEYRNHAAEQLCLNAGLPPEALQNLLLRALERRAAADHCNEELTLMTPHGEQPFRARISLLTEPDGRSGGAVAWLENMQTERGERGRHTEFVSSVCHELKTPMASIRAYTELLIDGDIEDEDSQRETLEFINEQVDRLTRLVDNMLNFARIESGVIKIQRTDGDLNSVLKTALDTVEPAARAKQLTVAAELSELYLPVHMDQDLFGQAIINLLSNAVKYTPSGGKITLRSRMEDVTAVVEIRDTGLGIPEASLPRLFERFYRVPENAQAASGTGLGLALVQYIVTNIHDGTIAVQSRVQEGTCFTVTVPLGHRPVARRRPAATAVSH